MWWVPVTRANVQPRFSEQAAHPFAGDMFTGRAPSYAGEPVLVSHGRAILRLLPFGTKSLALGVAPWKCGDGGGKRVAVGSADRG